MPRAGGRANFSAVSRVEEIERVIAQLPAKDFEQLADWINRRRWQTQPPVSRDHSAFLNSYVPEDEGLYDDAAAR